MKYFSINHGSKITKLVVETNNKTAVPNIIIVELQLQLFVNDTIVLSRVGRPEYQTHFIVIMGNFKFHLHAYFTCN